MHGEIIMQMTKFRKGKRLLGVLSLWLWSEQKACLCNNLKKKREGRKRVRKFRQECQVESFTKFVSLLRNAWNLCTLWKSNILQYVKIKATRALLPEWKVNWVRLIKDLEQVASMGSHALLIKSNYESARHRPADCVFLSLSSIVLRLSILNDRDMNKLQSRLPNSSLDFVACCLQQWGDLDFWVRLFLYDVFTLINVEERTYIFRAVLTSTQFVFPV